MDIYYKNLLYYLPDIVYQIDDEGTIIYINASVRKLGYEPDDLVGKSFETIIAPKYRNSANLLHYLSDNTGKPHKGSQPKFVNERRTGNRITKNLEVKLLPNEGMEYDDEELAGEVFATGLYDGSSKTRERYTGTIGIIRFTGDHYKSIKNLIRVENHYRLLIENSMEIIAIIAHDGTILYISNSVERNLGFKAFELIGENLESIIMESEVYLLKSVFKRIIGIGESGLGRKIELGLRDNHSRGKYYEVSVTPIINTDSEATMCYVFHMNDITRRKEIERSALRREQIYKTLLRTSPDAIMMIDDQGDIIMANDQAEKLTGRSREDLIGTGLGEIFQEDFFLGGLSDLIDKAGVINDMPFSIITDSREPVPVEASFSAVREQGRVLGFLTILKNITDRKKAEEQRDRLEKDLLNIVIRRLSKREIELLKNIYNGYSWPKKKRAIGKVMDVLPSTLDQFVYRIKKKMDMSDISRIASIAAIHFNWPRIDLPPGEQK